MPIFNEDLFKNNKKRKEITMKNTINITAVTVSPLTQMDNNSGQRKRYMILNGINYEIPFFSANGHRGILRRIATTQMYDIIKSKQSDFVMKPEEFYLYTSGSSTDKKSIENVTWQTEQKVREASPILSVFGGGLSSLAGKSAICDISPSRSMLKEVTYMRDGEEITKGASLIDKHTFFRGDDLSKDSFTKRLVDADDIADWVKEHQIKIAESKAKKKADSNNKEEFVSIQMPIDIEAIAPNVTLTSSISTVNGKEFTNLEIGMLLHAIHELTSMQMGANVRYGYGVLDWNIELDGEPAIVVECDKDYIFNRETKVSEKAQALIDDYIKWGISNYTDKIDIDSILAQ